MNTCVISYNIYMASKLIIKTTLIVLLILSNISTRTFAEDGSCAEMFKHLENAERTESILMITKFNRDSTVIPTEKDGHLWEMWQKLQRLKTEKEAEIEKYCNKVIP